ncbi:MAG TPA: type II secretion system protein [Armatimonadota bacterium]|nr:type II secretion system protein [Armatimonadota bacterium]
MRARPARRGFTLLELLIVITTILILASILFPIARAASDGANRSACVSNMHQISQLVTAYRQDYTGYPPPAGMIGLHGVPQEGVSALALANAGLAARDFWCPLDPFETRFGPSVEPRPSRDLTASTYSYGYNYYGLVTATDGQPFAVTSEAAARLLFDSGDVNWNLDLLEMKVDSQGTPHLRPKGLFQGLWNIHAPPDTVMTYCLNHPAEKPRVIPAVTAAGSAVLIRPVLPKDHQGTFLFESGPVPRQPNGTPRVAPIDWRINKAAYRKGNQQDNALFGDSAGNESATLMPVVETYYRFINLNAMQTLPIEADGAAWYDTGLDCTNGDIVMLRTSAKMNYYGIASVSDRAHWTGLTNGKEYSTLFDGQGHLYFNASGDPVEAKYAQYPANMVLPDQPHMLLIGKIGDTGTVFPIGSSGAYVVKPTEAGTLKLTFNDTQNDYTDNCGYCEVWFGFYRTNP